jgi:PAS domain S-box-containing protein
VHQESNEGPFMHEVIMNHRLSDNEKLHAEINELRRQRNAAEAMLSAERQMFHAMAETLTDVVFTTLPDGSWDFVNGRIYEITGLALGTAVGNGWSTALQPDDAENLMRGLREALASGTAFESNMRLRTHQGTYRRFVMQAQPVRDGVGRIVRCVGTATDVDDHLTAEEALQEVRRRNRESLLKLVHDLRNGIAPIAYAAAILKLPGADAAQRQEASATIEGQVRDLRAFLDKVSGACTDTRKPKDASDSRLLMQPSRRILLVASDDEIAQEWRMLLRIAGHDAIVVHDIPQALESAIAFQPEVLAVTLPLPGADASNWTQRLRQQPALERVFVVAIHEDADAKIVGCDAVLRKPVRLQDFLKLIAEHEPAAPRHV